MSTPETIVETALVDGQIPYQTHYLPALRASSFAITVKEGPTVVELVCQYPPRFKLFLHTREWPPLLEAKPTMVFETSCINTALERFLDIHNNGYKAE